MTTLREKMKGEMILVGLADSTQKRYLQEIIKLNDYYACSPAKLSTSQLRDYLLDLKKNSWRRILIMSLFMLCAFSIALRFGVP